MSEVLRFELSDTIWTALEVIAGVYGNGEERKKKLESDGYDYNKVQNCVNDLLKLSEVYK